MSRDHSEAPARTALDRFGVDVSHQEISRIVQELEELYKSQPGEWLPARGVASYLAAELGYEDEDEFEDALRSTFMDFLAKLPTIEVREIASELAPGTSRTCLRVVDDPSPRSGPRVLALRVETRDDLWRALSLSANASWGVPEIDFDVGGDVKRVEDSVYNHLARAVFTLERHAEALTRVDDDASDARAIARTCEGLRGLLDLETPWTLVVRDVDGRCAFKPSDGVEIRVLDDDDARV